MSWNFMPRDFAGPSFSRSAFSFAPKFNTDNPNRRRFAHLKFYIIRYRCLSLLNVQRGLTFSGHSVLTGQQSNLCGTNISDFRCL